MNLAKKKGMTVTQQSLCVGLERGRGAWIPQAGMEGGGKREETHVSLVAWLRVES